jgi:hypothetical protein
MLDDCIQRLPACMAWHISAGILTSVLEANRRHFEIEKSGRDGTDNSPWITGYGMWKHRRGDQENASFLGSGSFKRAGLPVLAPCSRTGSALLPSDQPKSIRSSILPVHNSFQKCHIPSGPGRRSLYNNSRWIGTWHSGDGNPGRPPVFVLFTWLPDIKTKPLS